MATTTSMALLEALREAGVSHIFANLGSDHPGIVEALAEGAARGLKLPALITCPSEMVALSAAQGFAQLTGRAQCVLVHVDCGTQALAGAVHNAARSRTPVLILAGASPYTQEGELKGGRNEFIHWLQDVRDQRGVVRGYMKYDAEIRTGENVGQMVRRAMQIALSEPRGPVYLMAAREVLEAEAPHAANVPARWSPLAPAALADEDAEAVAAALAEARRPLIVTSYAGRNADAVEALVGLACRLGAGVLESAPSALNFPADDPHHLGDQWNEPRQSPELAEADVVLVVDSDVPWIPAVNRPARQARIFHIDVDPLKEAMALWDIGAERAFRADAATALTQIERRLAGLGVDQAEVAERQALLAGKHAARRAERRRREATQGAITPPFLMATLRERIDDGTIVLNEAITNYGVVTAHLERTRPGTLFASGGSSLAWSGGAAVGMKLAAPERTVVAVTGDGSFMFAQPSTVFWMARRYRVPFLQVVLNNGGWRAPRFSTLQIHPDGYASRANDIGTSFDPAPDYAGIAAAAGGALGLRVEDPEALGDAFDAGLKAVREEGRSVVIDVLLAQD